jgi:hypothetical protein
MTRGASRLRSRTGLPAEDVTALVNAALVLLLPSGFIAVAWLLPEPPNTVSARVSSNFEYWTRNFFQVATVFIPFVPLSLVAAWRTRMYARRYMRGEGTGWRGVAEAGALGFAVAILVLSRGILMRPAEAPPYILFYGGIAVLLGLAVGCVLRIAGILVLKVLA